MFVASDTDFIVDEILWKRNSIHNADKTFDLKAKTIIFGELMICENEYQLL